MLIECLIRRDGATHLRLNGFEYVFGPNEHGHNVCEVNSREHREYLTSLKDFREYEPPVSPDLPPMEMGEVAVEPPGEVFTWGLPRKGFEDGNGSRADR